MKILSVEAQNFGSYKSLNFSNEGLCLVYGKTGSGKSTIPDVVAWTLFGTTAKDGAADDVKSWQSEGVTEGKVVTETITAVRRRGPGANDLYFYDLTPTSPTRGKDLRETQKILDQRLGVSADLFIAGSYYHEFSRTGAFFTANAKDRRNLLEMLASLDLPKTLAEKSSAERKDVKSDIEDLSVKLSGTKASVIALEQALIDNDRMSDSHVKTKNQKIVYLQSKANNFDKHYNFKLERLMSRLSEIDKNLLPQDYFSELLASIDFKEASLEQDKCQACGADKHYDDFLANDRIVVLQNRSKNELLIQEQNSLLDQLESLQLETNTYMHQVEALKSEINPFDTQESRIVSRLSIKEKELLEQTTSLNALNARLSALDTLHDLSYTLRGELLKTAVTRIQDDTNKYLETYFDAEIRVAFNLEGSDNLTVEIQKSGFDCNYKQLSKGQRGLLKLCFSVSVMKLASERCGVHFDNLYFDESLDGLDAALKIKAFSLLEKLSTEHSSVLVIDHAEEFQNMFHNKYLVSMEGDHSKIEEQNGF